MKIAIASGKGGTGKTTLSTNLALALAANGRSVAYLDCDVEEPNGHIFLAPQFDRSRDVSIPVPVVNDDKCTYCGACGAVCRFSAILTLGDKVITFPELCHGCGACSLVCEDKAITEVDRRIGIIEEGRTAEGILFTRGLLDVGESMAPPVISAVLQTVPATDITILDAPPGATCPTIEAIRDADVVILVTEPTPFGLSDLKLAVGMVRTLGIPLGVVVNRAGAGNLEVHEYCEAEGIEIWLEIPDDRRIAELYSRGEPAVRTMPELERELSHLAARLAEKVVPGRVEPRFDTVAFEMPSDLPPTPSERAGPGRQPDVDELVVISGKGGTGKTSVAASLAALAEDAMVADCDVDAADLYLVLSPDVRTTWPFTGGAKARIVERRCAGCGECQESCRYDAIHDHGGIRGPEFAVNVLACEGCGACVTVCPTDAIEMVPVLAGEWFLSDTRQGPMVHARLAVTGDNSGKLVSLVRREARAVAAEEEKELVIVDGSPGIGCPVIASITGARLVLIVAEPTLSGLHDMKRVAELTRQLKVEAAICVNKFDINPEITERIEREARELGLTPVGRIHYDPEVTTAQVRSLTVVEHGEGPAAQDLSLLWQTVQSMIKGARAGTEKR